MGTREARGNSQGLAEKRGGPACRGSRLVNHQTVVEVENSADARAGDFMKSGEYRASIRGLVMALLVAQGTKISC
ncbi:hypothetical protein MRX96_058337 [Rhipicephalus microplus]